jgi:hypothetical protein
VNLPDGLLRVSCGDASHCLIVGESPAHSEIATTATAGRTWRVTGLPSGWLNMPTALDCANGLDCWVAMSEYSFKDPGYSHPNIEVTHDGGASWSTLSLPDYRPAIADVLALGCPSSGDGCLGVGNLADHFAAHPNGHLSGPLLLSNLPLSST